MAEPSPPAAALLVLVVDDVEDNRDMYAQFLQHEGWRVATAADGVEGLALATQLRPDIIVLDLGLPRIDGWDVARRLKESPITRAIPVLALTGHVGNESRLRALMVGVSEFCTKPCLPADLVAAIRRNLRRAPA